MALDPNTTLPGTGEVYAATERTVEGVLAKHQRVLISTFDGESVDASGRWRVSNPQTVFSSKLLDGDNQPLLWDEDLISGTMATSGPTAAKPFIDFTSTNVTAGKRTRQTFRRFNNQPGKSQLILMTGILELASGTKTGCVREIGLFDDSNGAFFESDAGTIGVTVRTNDTGSPVDTTVAQASWSLDTMDGGADAANPSGDTLDVSKIQNFIIDFQWSAGRVRFGLELHGLIHYVHEHLITNSAVIPWASTPNLPLRYQITTTSSSGICSMRVVYSAVINEGGTDEDVGIVHHRGTAGAAVVTDTENTLFAVVGIRLKTDHFGETIHVLQVAMQIQTTGEFAEWILIFNPTVASTFTYADLTNSAVQTALGATANTVTGGTHMGGGYIETGGSQSGGGSEVAGLATSLILGADIADVPDEIVLCVRPIGGVSAMGVEGALIWRETH